MILNRLHLAKSVIKNRESQINKLNELIKARFVEMFGDMLINPKGLPEQRLDSLADIVSGITKGRKVKTVELYEVPYMAVSNVKDGYIDWTTVKTIMATTAEIDQYRLMPGDVLMTEGGDPDKLGRGATIALQSWDEFAFIPYNRIAYAGYTDRKTAPDHFPRPSPWQISKVEPQHCILFRKMHKEHCE